MSSEGALQRLYDDPAVVRAMEVLAKHAITGEQYDELVAQQKASAIRYEPKDTMKACGECYACEGGDPEMCYGCPNHGAWCDWFGEGPNCNEQSPHTPINPS